MSGQYKDKEKRKFYQKIYHRGWRARNREKLLLAEKTKRWQQRKTVIAYYSKNSNQCNKCQYDDIRALVIDHVENDGNKHRQALKRATIYIWLIQNGFPSGFQVLCHNCNWIKHRVYSSLRECKPS